MLETEIALWLKQHLGILGSILGLLLLLGIRFLPTWLQGLREKRLEKIRLAIQDKQEITQREKDLFSRIDRKDALLEKLTSNHIQHLEMQLSQSREFYTEAIRSLRAISLSQEGIQREIADLKEDTETLKGDTAFLKGRASA